MPVERFPNNTKIIKKQKLRNVEYYDFQNIQDELYKESIQGKTFSRLMDTITTEENILLAYRNIKKNYGSKTAGTDGRTIKYLAMLSNEELIYLVKNKLAWYTPQKVRRVEIPKDNGKTRPLGIPTITDRMIQQCILQVLEPICEAKFYKHSYGFRPFRSAEHALHRFIYLTNRHDFHYVVDVDIKAFFDTVNHGKLLKQIWTLGIQDKKLIKIISLMLKAEVAGIGFPQVGTPQGGIISPLLANIVLNELDWWITGQWEGIPSRYNYADKYKKLDALKKTNLKECYIVRYADDFKIFCKNYDYAKRWLYAVKMWLKDRLGLEINEEKSKIVNLKKQYSEFLGFRFKVIRKGNRYVTRSFIKEKAKEKIISKAKTLISEIQHANNKYLKITHYNAFVIGVHNYYNKASCVSLDFKDIAYRIRECFNARLKTKKKGYIPEYINKVYGKSKQLRFVSNIAIVPMAYIKYAECRPFINGTNKYSVEGRMRIHKNLQCTNKNILLYLMRNPVKSKSVEFNDNRISLYAGQNGKCGITQQPFSIGDIYCHHKIPIKNGGIDAYHNLILVTENIHKLIHATHPETINELIDLLKLKFSEMNKVNELRLLAGMNTI